METSDHYIVIERMIRQREVLMSELKHLLDSLEDQGRITVVERHALLKLAEEQDLQKHSTS
jgi:hypothetical protein